MTNITVVTTFHQSGLEKYGQRFINSFAEKVDIEKVLHAIVSMKTELEALEHKARTKHAHKL